MSFVFVKNLTEEQLLSLRIKKKKKVEIITCSAIFFISRLPSVKQSIVISNLHILQIFVRVWCGKKFFKFPRYR